MINKEKTAVGGETAQNKARLRPSWVIKSAGAMLISGIIIANIAGCGTNRAETDGKPVQAKKNMPTETQWENKRQNDNSQQQVDDFYSKGMQNR